MRFWVILVVGLMAFSTLAMYEVPSSVGHSDTGSIRQHFAERGLAYTKADNRLLDNVYWAAAIGTVFPAGLIVERRGIASVGIWCGFGAAMANILFLIGVAARVFPLMVVARIFLGLCGPLLILTQFLYVVRWCGAASWMAFCLLLLVQRAATVSGYFVFTAISTSVNIYEAMWFGVFISFFSAAFCFIAGQMDELGTLYGYVRDQKLRRPDGMNLGGLGMFTVGCWLVVAAVGISMGVENSLFSMLRDAVENRFSLTAAAARLIALYAQIAFVGGALLVGAFLTQTGYPARWMATCIVILAVCIFTWSATVSISPTVISVFIGLSAGGIWIASVPMVPLLLLKFHALLYGIVFTVACLLTVADLSVSEALLSDYKHTPCANGTHNGTHHNATAAPNGTHAPSHVCPHGHLATTGGYAAVHVVLGIALVVALVFTVLLSYVDSDGDRVVERKKLKCDAGDGTLVVDDDATEMLVPEEDVHAHTMDKSKSRDEFSDYGATM